MIPLPRCGGSGDDPHDDQTHRSSLQADLLHQRGGAVTPYYEDDSTTIWHGDCSEVMAALPAGCAELVAADPPYFRVVDAEWDRQDWAGPAEFLEWIGAAVVLMDRALHERGTLAVFCHPDMASGVEMEVRKVANYLNHIVWRKPELGRLGMAEKESLRRFFPTSERIILAEKGRNPDGDLFRFRDHVNHSTRVAGSSTRVAGSLSYCRMCGRSRRRRWHYDEGTRHRSRRR